MVDTSCTSQCTVIQDIANGWEGSCMGLQQTNSSTTAAACREACCSDPNCEVWQWGNTREMASQSSLGICKTGRGLECSSDHFENFLVLAGQRVSHGAPSATVKLASGRWCTGAGMLQAKLEPVQAQDSALQRCRDVCYQDASCSVWQYSISEGCWYGSADSCATRLYGAADVLGGEKVSRACQSGEQLRLHTDYVRVFGVIGAVASLLTLVATVVLMVAPLLRKRGRPGSEGSPPSSGRRLFSGSRDPLSEGSSWEDEADDCLHDCEKPGR